jgi:hypothetical protein
MLARIDSVTAEEIDSQGSGLELWRGVVQKLHAHCSAKWARISVAPNAQHTQLLFMFLDPRPELRDRIYPICITEEAAAQDTKSKIHGRLLTTREARPGRKKERSERRQRALNGYGVPDIGKMSKEDESISTWEYYAFKRRVDQWNSHSTTSQEDTSDTASITDIGCFHRRPQPLQSCVGKSSKRSLVF